MSPLALLQRNALTRCSVDLASLPLPRAMASIWPARSPPIAFSLISRKPALQEKQEE
jgi:hypothetical protein